MKNKLLIILYLSVSSLTCYAGDFIPLQAYINNKSEMTGSDDLKGCKFITVNAGNVSDAPNSLYVVKCDNDNLTQYSYNTQLSKGITINTKVPANVVNKPSTKTICIDHFMYVKNGDSFDKLKTKKTEGGVSC